MSIPSSHKGAIVPPVLRRLRGRVKARRLNYAGGHLPPGSRPRVALTFDDGPDANTTDAVLDVLLDSGVPATFFVVGEMCELHPAPIRRAADVGMCIGIHGWAHVDLLLHDVDFMYEDLRRAIDVVRRFNVRPNAFRPPYGSWDDELLRVAASLGLRTFAWNVDSHDWTGIDAAGIAEGVVRDAEDRSIILFHDGGGDRTQTVAALPVVIAGLRERGFSFAPLTPPMRRWRRLREIRKHATE